MAELNRLQPAEILLPSEAPDINRVLRPGEAKDQLPAELPPQWCYTLRSPQDFQAAEARQRLCQRFQVKSLEGFGCEHLPLAMRAAGGLLAYLDETHRHQPVPLQNLSTYSLAQYLFLDPQTRRNLELTQTVRDGNFQARYCGRSIAQRRQWGGVYCAAGSCNPSLTLNKSRAPRGHCRIDGQ